MTTGPILAAVDLHAGDRDVAALAAAFARAASAPLELVHVEDVGSDLDPTLPVPAEVAAAVEALRRRVRARTEECVRALELERRAVAAELADTTANVVEGRPYAALVERAAARKAALLVIGPHGSDPAHAVRGAVRDRLLGSTADRVIRHAPCPVLVAAGRAAPVAELAGRPWVVGVDFSDASREALRVAARWAAPFDGRLLLVCARAAPDLGPDGAFTTEAALVERLLELGREHAPGLAVSAETPVGPAAEAVTHVARAHAAAIVVLGTRGRSQLASLLLGSTAEACLRRATVPVLLTRSAPAAR